MKTINLIIGESLEGISRDEKIEVFGQEGRASFVDDEDFQFVYRNKKVIGALLAGVDSGKFNGDYELHQFAEEHEEYPCLDEYLRRFGG